MLKEGRRKVRFTRKKPAERARKTAPAASEPAEKDASAALPDNPACPKCGWHDVRPSIQKGLLDRLLATLSFRAFRCRTCEHRFHSFRRAGGN
jgi:rubredoxin